MDKKNNKAEAAAYLGKTENTMLRRHKIFRLVVVLAILAVVGTGVYFLLKELNVLEKIDSLEKIRALILGAGFWSYFVFFILQFLQVTFIPIPSMLSTLAGTLIFGPLVAFIYSAVAILAGSIVAFYLGRKYGVRIISWVMGKQDAEKFRGNLSKCRYMFCLMLLFPFSPDDILCLVAGTTNMSSKFFLTSVICIRPISIFCLCFFGSGSVIPFATWSIPIWIVFAAVMITLFILSVKYRNKIESKLNTAFSKIKRKI